MNTPEKTSVETQDIILAATLKTLGYKLEGIEKIGNRGIFFFKDVPDSVVSEYYLGSVLVEPQAFNAATKALTTAARRKVD